MDTRRVNPYHITDLAELSIGGAARVLTDAGAPTAVAPDFVGQIYINTTGSVIYMAYGITTGDWKIIAA